MIKRAPQGALFAYAGHDQPLGGASPLWRLMAPTTSRGQLRRREAGWEGSRRRNRDPRDTNRIRGGAVRASQDDVAKPDAIKGPSRKCGGCLTPGCDVAALHGRAEGLADIAVVEGRPNIGTPQTYTKSFCWGRLW